MALPPQRVTRNIMFRFDGTFLSAFAVHGPESVLPPELRDIKCPFEKGDTVSWREGWTRYTLQLSASAWDQSLSDRYQANPRMVGPSAGSGVFILKTRFAWFPVWTSSREIDLRG